MTNPLILFKVAVAIAVWSRIGQEAVLEWSLIEKVAGHGRVERVIDVELYEFVELALIQLDEDGVKPRRLLYFSGDSGTEVSEGCFEEEGELTNVKLGLLMDETELERAKLENKPVELPYSMRYDGFGPDRHLHKIGAAIDKKDPKRTRVTVRLGWDGREEDGEAFLDKIAKAAAKK